MTLITLLVALALEYFFGALDRVRNYAWFDAGTAWLERRCAGTRLWDGPGGVLLTLGIPVLVLVVIVHFALKATVILGFVIAVAVLIYSLGPDLNSRLDRYAAALEAGDENAVNDIESELQVPGVTGEDGNERMIRSILIRAHDHVFGVVFWFIVLGMYGALLYCLSARLYQRFGDIHGGYGGAVRDLHRILMWPSARLQALGFGLAGNLVDALDGWRNVGGMSLESSDDLLGAAGIGAIRYGPDRKADEDDSDEETSDFSSWVQETQALINRTLIVWLTVLGVMTLGGWLH